MALILLGGFISLIMALLQIGDSEKRWGATLAPIFIAAFLVAGANFVFFINDILSFGRFY